MHTHRQIQIHLILRLSDKTKNKQMSTFELVLLDPSLCGAQSCVGFDSFDVSLQSTLFHTPTIKM